MALSLTGIETPALILDRSKMYANIDNMRGHVRALGCTLRPHVKTAKAMDVVRCMLGVESDGITVSTLKEADFFFAQGLRDIVYAVGLAPSKVSHVIALTQQGANLSVLVDNPRILHALSNAARSAGVDIPVLIELDVDGHRAGVEPTSPQLLDIARAVVELPALSLRGVLTHAGGSYDCRTAIALEQMAEQERSRAVLAAERLRATGFAVPVVSIGSTPSVLFSRDLTGVTEVRAGVYVFHDLVMAGIGVCTLEDIAVSVLVTVIGHQPGKGWLITDGGWTALSRDRGTGNQPNDQAYGLVCDVAGIVMADDLVVNAVNQEHGIIVRRDGGPLDDARYPVGTLLRVLPNHVCATAGEHAEYHVVDGRSADIVAVWPRFSGW